MDIIKYLNFEIHIKLDFPLIIISFLTNTVEGEFAHSKVSRENM